jgi:hypothetical protein
VDFATPHCTALPFLLWSPKCYLVSWALVLKNGIPKYMEYSNLNENSFLKLYSQQNGKVLHTTFNVVPADCHTLVSTFWKLLNSSFKEGAMTSSFSGISCLLKTPSLFQTNDNQMELSLDCTVDEAGHPTSVSLELPSLQQQCEEHCLGGRKLNPAFFFTLSELLASLFHSGELNSTVH